MARTSPSRPGLRVMTYNVHSCFGLDGRLSVGRIVSIVRAIDPDVAILQEVDMGRARSGRVDQAAELARELEMDMFYAPTIDDGDGQGWRGTAILTRARHEIIRSELFPQVRVLPERIRRGAIWFKVETQGGAVDVMGTHLGLSRVQRRLQVAELLGPRWMGDKRCGPHRVLCGDFNTFPWSEQLRPLDGPLRDAHRIGAGGWGGTWLSFAPLARIDYIWASTSMKVARCEVICNRRTIGASDHLPLVADFRI